MIDQDRDRGTGSTGQVGGGGADMLDAAAHGSEATGAARRPGPRKVNRRDPEKRREQNRAAQKVYRE